MKDVIVSNTLYWIVIGFMAILFVATIIFNSYLFVLDNKITQQANLSRVNSQKSTIAIYYGDGQTKTFRGYVPTEGLSLYDALLSSAEAGGLKISFIKDEEGRIRLVSIDRFINDGKNCWEIEIPNIKWSRKLCDANIDLQKIYLTGGTIAHIVYK